jgi:hypothetical protein
LTKLPTDCLQATQARKKHSGISAPSA